MWALFIITRDMSVQCLIGLIVLKLTLNSGNTSFYKNIIPENDSIVFGIIERMVNI